MKVASILANSADPDEMQHNAAFLLGLHCLPKYPFRDFQYTMSLRMNLCINILMDCPIHLNNKKRIVQFVFYGVAGQNFYKMMYFYP